MTTTIKSKKPAKSKPKVIKETVNINEAIIKQISGFAKLKDNWDNEGAPRPSDKVIAEAIAFCEKLTNLNEKVYYTTHGLEGEIHVELQTKSKRGHIEFLFFPKETIFVKVLKRYARQGKYQDNLLPSLLDWLKNF